MENVDINEWLCFNHQMIPTSSPEGTVLLMMLLCGGVVVLVIAVAASGVAASAASLGGGRYMTCRHFRWSSSWFDIMHMHPACAWLSVDSFDGTFCLRRCSLERAEYYRTLFAVAVNHRRWFGVVRVYVFFFLSHTTTPTKPRVLHWWLRAPL